MNHWSEKVDPLARELAARFGPPPAVAIVLGSGQTGAAKALCGEGQIAEVSYAELLGVPMPSVAGHAGVLIKPASADRIIAAGRSHLYEGLPAEDVVRLVRAFARWGVKTLVLTNASGSLRSERKPGQIVIIEDHINLSGANPLTGSHRDGYGERFPDMSGAYDVKLRKAARRAARRLKIYARSGIYIQVSGPSYETPAEVAAFGRLGADIVGMSTAIETIAARHLGMRVLGLSIVTNYAGGRGGKLSHHDVIRVAAEAEQNLVKLVEETLRVEKLPPRSPDRKRP